MALYTDLLSSGTLQSEALIGVLNDVNENEEGEEEEEYYEDEDYEDEEYFEESEEESKHAKSPPQSSHHSKPDSSVLSPVRTSGNVLVSSRGTPLRASLSSPRVGSPALPPKKNSLTSGQKPQPKVIPIRSWTLGASLDSLGNVLESPTRAAAGASIDNWAAVSMGNGVDDYMAKMELTEPLSNADGLYGDESLWASPPGSARNIYDEESWRQPDHGEDYAVEETAMEVLNSRCPSRGDLEPEMELRFGTGGVVDSDEDSRDAKETDDQVLRQSMKNTSADSDEYESDFEPMRVSMTSSLHLSKFVTTPPRAISEDMEQYKEDEEEDEEEEYENEEYFSEEEGSEEEADPIVAERLFSSYRDFYGGDEKATPREEKGSSLPRYRKDHLSDDDNVLNGETENEHAGEELREIVNDYTELLSYINSPRAEELVANLHDSMKRGSVKQVQKLLNSTVKNDNVVKREKLPKKMLRPAKPAEPTKQRSNPVLPTSSASASNRKYSYMLHEDNGVLNRNRRRQVKKINQDPAAMAAVMRRHKEMLSGLANKKKDEEDAQKAAQLAEEERRRKYRDMILEKASRKVPETAAVESLPSARSRGDAIPLSSRRHQGDNIKESAAPVRVKPIESNAHLLAPTAAYRNQIVVRTANEVLKTDEELAREEEARREQVAAIRRRFKEQHKQILASLAARRKEEENKSEMDRQIEEENRIKRKKRLDRLLAQRGESSIKQQQADVVDTKESAPSTITPPKPTKRLTSDRKEKDLRNNNLAEAKNTSAQDNRDSKAYDAKTGGDAKDEVASRRPRPSFTTEKVPTVAPRPRISHREREAEEAKAAEVVVDPAAKAAAREQMRRQQAKLSEYLESLAESRRKEEADKKAQEDRHKKRVQLLSQRVLSEKSRASDVDSEAETKRLHSSKRNEDLADKDDDKDEPTQSVTRSVPRVASLTSKRPPEGPPENSYSVPQPPNLPAGTIPIRDFGDWKRKNGVPPDGQVFCMTGWYPSVKQELLDRGWHLNSDPQSPYFNLKWTLRSVDVSQEALQPWQLTNHYIKNVAITTKAGLIKSLKSAVWLADVDIRGILPRAYDLTSPMELQIFIDDYRTQRAESMLKKLYHRINGLEYVPRPINLYQRPSTAALQGKVLSETLTPTEAGEPPLPPCLEGVVLEDIELNATVFAAACRVLENVIRPYDDASLDDPIHSQSYYDYSNIAMTDLDWEILSYGLHEHVGSLPLDPPEPVDGFLRGKHEEEELNAGQSSNNKPSYQAQQAAQRARRKQQRLYEEAREEVSNNIRKMTRMTMADYQRIHHILTRLHLHHGEQYALNGPNSASHNIWIVKPAAKSRGRGIQTFSDLNKLLKYTEAGSGMATQWIVQKYIENPMIVAKRKFDFRQWVLVTDWNPLTIWFYNECYVRVSVDEYSNATSDLDNLYVHLVNNSIGKNSEKFGQTIYAENGAEIDGYMMSQESFSQFLRDTTGTDMMKEKLQPQMKQIAKWSLMCAAEAIEHRKNSWELYGFDYMVDTEGNAWLIEINSSPACDYSTKVTERYIQKALVELLAVTLDVRQWDNTPKKSRGEKPNTGDWECIYQGAVLDIPAGSFGTDMSLKGEGLKVPRRAPIPVGPPSFSGMSERFSSTRNSVDVSSSAKTDTSTKAPRVRSTVRSSVDNYDDSDEDELPIRRNPHTEKRVRGALVPQPPAPSGAAIPIKLYTPDF